MINFIKKLLHKKLDYGFPILRNYDGFQWYARCELCDKKLLRDSTGTYFHSNESYRDYVNKKEEARRESNYW